MYPTVKSITLAAFIAALTACGGSGGGSTTPTPQPTAEPTAEPTTEPTPEPTAEPITVTSLHALADFPVGVAVPAGGFSNSLLDSTERQEIVEAHFDQLTAENIMKPYALHPAESTYTFGDADALVNYAKANGMDIHGHTLVWHSQIPSWMQNYSGDQAAWTAMMESHITSIVDHFETFGNVVSWDVVNEAYTDANPSSLRSSPWLTGVGSDYIAKAFIAAEAADADVDLYYNDYNLENNGAKLDAVIDMVEDFQANSVPIDGVGFQAHVFLDFPSIEDIRAAMGKVVATGLKLKLSELDVSLKLVETRDIDELTPEIEQELADRYKAIVEAYLDVVPSAQRGGITVWGIIDADSWLPNHRGRPEYGLLFKDDFSPKQALQSYADALTGN